MEIKDMVMQAARAISDKKGTDIVIIDISEASSFADYFLLASGRHERQIAGLEDAAEDEMAKMGLVPKSIEGKPSSGWILMDYGDIIVNILTEEMRERYHIEKVWEDCPFLPFEE